MSFRNPHLTSSMIPPRMTMTPHIPQAHHCPILMMTLFLPIVQIVPRMKGVITRWAVISIYPPKITFLIPVLRLMITTSNRKATTTPSIPCQHNNKVPCRLLLKGKITILLKGATSTLLKGVTTLLSADVTQPTHAHNLHRRKRTTDYTYRYSKDLHLMNIAKPHN